MFRLIITILTFICVSTSSFASATDQLINNELPNIKKLFSSKAKVDEAALKKYISENLEESSPEYQKQVIDNVKKVSPNNRARKFAQLIYDEKKYLKQGQACYSATNQCIGKLICGFPLVAEKANYYEKCLVPKDEGQRCSQTSDICLKGSCKNLLRVTNINSCTTFKESCKRDSDCCSKSCNKKTKTCDANYRCSSCIEIGGKPAKGQECCESLFKNTNGVCSPILPTFSFLLDLLIPQAQAAQVDNSAEAKLLLTQMKSQLSQLFDDNGVSTSASTSYLDNLSKNMSRCSSLPISTFNLSTDYPRRDCFNKLVADVKPELNYQHSVKSKLNEANTIVDNYRKEASSNPDHPLYNTNEFSKFEAPINSNLKKCVNQTSNLGSDFSSRLSNINSCVDNVKVSINDKIVEADYQLVLNGESSTDPNYALFNGASNSYPLFQNVHTSDMKNCRVNLFGDFIGAQSNDYFEIMMMMFAMDYTTGGKDEGDFFHIKSQYNTKVAASGSYTGADNQVYNWNREVNSMRGYNLNTFDPAVVKRGGLWDEFDESVGESALKEIKKYLDGLEDADKKVFLKMYYNGKLSDTDRNLIINYYMKKDIKFLDTFDVNNPKAGAGRYNIRDVVRFEAIKYKLHLFKLYGTLQKRSLEMMCRCVDTVGPMSADDWLQPDVEENYLANCNGLGKYDTYVIDNEKEICTGEGENQKCTTVSSKDFSETVTDKEKEEIASLGGNAALEQNSVGNTVVRNNGYSIKDRNEDFFVQTLDQVTACIGSGECDKTSRYGDFVKNGKLSFKSERENTAKGHGEDFSLFLRDMALMKIKAIEEASLQNINHGTALFEYTVDWLKNYKWNYTKYNGKRYTKNKKCIYPVCFILQNLKFLGSFINSIFSAITNVMTGGVLVGADFDIDMNPARGPENICGPRTSSTWKKAKVPIGKKYNIKCMSFHALKNDVCNQVLSVGSCTRNTYIWKEGAASLKLIDPFLPDMTSLYNSPYTSEAKIPFKADKESYHNYFELNDNITKFYKDHAKGYFLSTLVSTDNGSDEENNDRKRMAQDFAQYSYRYHFYAPKVSRVDYYISPGLIPYFEMLIAKLNNYMGQSLANLARTAAYALKMHNYHYIVNTGLTDSTKLDRREAWDDGIPDLQLTSDFGQFTNWLSGFSSAANQFDKALQGDKTIGKTVDGKLREGAGSANQAISGVSKGVRKQLQRNANRSANRKLMNDTLKSRGKSEEMARLQAIADQRSAEHSSALGSLTDQFLKNALGSNAAARARARSAALEKEKSAALQEGFTQEAIDPEKSSSSKGQGSKKGAGTVVAAAKATDVDLVSFDNLDETEGLFEMDDDAWVTLGDKKVKAGQLKRYVANQKVNGEKRKNLMKNDNDWERDNVSLFGIISERYQISAFPKILK